MGIKYPERQSIRLRGFDYSQLGWYFVTICTHKRQHLFGSVVDGGMELNDIGIMVDKWWKKLGDKYSNLRMHDYIIMPNHTHGIIQIVRAIPCNRPSPSHHNHPHVDNTGENTVSPLPIVNTYDGVGSYISWFKRMTTNEYIRNVKNKQWQRFNKHIWQRNYHDHIIRDAIDLHRIQEYIRDNPANWDIDTLNIR